jgi:hypothetical protein
MGGVARGDGSSPLVAPVFMTPAGFRSIVEGAMSVMEAVALKEESATLVALTATV